MSQKFVCRKNMSGFESISREIVTMNIKNGSNLIVYNTMVLIFCVEFWELSHLTRDLSQAEEKIYVITS